MLTLAPERPAEVLERQPRLGGITEAMVARATAREGRSRAANTVRNYGRAWDAFAAWCRGMEVTALPAPVGAIKVYLDRMIDERGWMPSTVRSAFAAISDVHRRAGYGDVVRDASFRDFLAAVDRDDVRRQRQARPLREGEMTQVRFLACLPRKRETQAQAWARGLTDIAILQVMRDALLRVGEAAALTWGDVEYQVDGCALLHVRRSKTDRKGEGKTLLLSPLAVEDLRRAFPDGPGAQDERVFGLGPRQIGERVRRVCEHAGLGAGYSGHSPRVGMAQDMAAMDIGTPALMDAGRWKNAAMVARYTSSQEVYRGALARYRGLEPPAGGLPAQPGLEVA